MRQLMFGTLARESVKNQSTQNNLFSLIILWLLLTLIAAPSTRAGTFRDDFDNEEDFLKDKQFREGGVWGEDIAQFTWENGAIKGRNDRNDANFCFALITGDYGWKDYTVECKAKLITDLDFDFDGIGLALRRPCIDCAPYYSFFFGRHPGGNTGVSIGGKKGEKEPMKALAIAPFQNIRKDVWYTLKAVAQGEQLEFYVDNKLVLEAKDNAFPAGKAGFAVQNGGGGPLEALFDDFIMTGPEVKAHDQAVEPQSKLATTWGEIKRSR
ncbi:MAG: hypothetical protein ACE5PV_15460 [Candidatus Poribacteria bacterium]